MASESANPTSQNGIFTSLWLVWLPLVSSPDFSFIFVQTNYQIPKEEVEVYKILGEHEHIVKHYGGTFRGCEGHASIFMEKCGMLKNWI